MLRSLTLLIPFLLVGCPKDTAAPLEVAPVVLSDAPVAISEDLLRRAAENTFAEGGATVDVQTGELINDGELFAVSLGDEKPVKAANVEELLPQLVVFAAERREELEDPTAYLGTWQDPADGTIYLDVTVLVPFAGDREAALQKALALGKEENQDTIYDMSQKVDIPVPK